MRRARAVGPVPLETVREAIVCCEACPRLRSYCLRVAREKKAAHRDDVYWGKPVPGFGDPAARLLVVGLRRPRTARTAPDAFSLATARATS